MLAVLAHLTIVLSAIVLPTSRPVSDEPAPTEATIRVGETVRGTISASDPKLDERGSVCQMALVPKASGLVTLSLESFDFDAYLKVESDTLASPLASDGGGIESNARLVVEVRAASRYVVNVAAHGKGEGEYTLTVTSGRTALPKGAALTLAGAEYQAIAADRALTRGDKKSAAFHTMVRGDRLGTPSSAE